MQKISYVCDRCGKDTFEIRGKFTAAYVSNLTDTARTDITVVEKLDFCDKCFEKLLDLMEGKEEQEPAPAEIEVEVNIPEPEVEEPTPVVIEVEPDIYEVVQTVKKEAPVQQKRRPIDWDKAVALKKAGWTHAKIADELGTTLATINVGIYRHIGEFENKKAQEAKEAKRKVLDRL